MKLTLIVVTIIAIFPADSRDIPDKPDQDEHSFSQLMGSDVMEERKEEEEMKLRGNALKKNIKALKKILETLTNDISEIKIENQAINESLDALKDGNTKLTQDDSEMKNSLDSLNTKLTQADSEMKNSLDSLKDGNTKLTQADSEMKNSLDSLKDGNAKLTQDFSEMNTELQAIKKRQGGTIVSGQYLTFSTEKVSWDAAVAKCNSFNARLAVLTNPQAFIDFAKINYSGHGFWLGASDKSREGTWTWINGQSLGNFPWGSGEPNDAGGNEDCLEFNNRYNDIPCNYNFRYVCEHDFN